MARRRKHEEEHENHERWLVSYADFITLLFAFFVVMYAVSRVDNKRLSQAAASIKWALSLSGTGGVGHMPMFDGPPSDGGHAIDMGGSGPNPTPQALAEAVRRRVESRVRPFVIPRQGPPAVTLVVEGRNLTIRLAAAEFFDPGQAVLRPDVLPVLDAIADEVVPLARPMRIEGHTDDTPMASGRYRDNWELSAARAATVTSYLERGHHAAPELLVASGFAATRPVDRGTDAAARERNRRVELVVDVGEERPARPRSDVPMLKPLGP